MLDVLILSEDWDYRLPGGKMVDSYDEFLPYEGKPELLKEKIEEAVKIESKQEAGIKVKTAELFKKSVLGASIEWDLYFYHVIDYDICETGNNPEDTEIIIPEWFTFAQAMTMCLDGRIGEDRSVGILLNFLLNNKVQSQE